MRRESQFNTTSMWAMGAPPDRSHISQLGGSGRHSGQDPDAWALAHPPPCPMHRPNAQGPAVTTDKAAETSRDPAPSLHGEAGVITAPSLKLGGAREVKLCSLLDEK